MPIEVKMPALSPTMEQGTLAKWLVREGDVVNPGDLIAEIETDKATMEFEAVDEGRIAKILVQEGTESVAVGTVIALLGEAVEADCSEARAELAAALAEAAPAAEPAVPLPPVPPRHDPVLSAPRGRLADTIRISPLAARIAEARGIGVEGLKGTGPGGRIVKADLGLKANATPVAAAAQPVAAPVPVDPIADVPHELVKLSGMRRTIARRLTESKQQVPHIYLTVDVALDPLLGLRAELNQALAPRRIRLSVNDMIIKALALALIEVPACNVQFAGDQIARFRRADISVAVSVPNGLITPVITDAAGKSLSAIAGGMKELAARAREGRLQPHEYQGGTASLSNLGMFGIRQFDAVINPPQAMIMAVGTGEKRPVVARDKVEIATVLSATGSFDHRAIDGADAAQLMQAFKQLIEDPRLILA